MWTRFSKATSIALCLVLLFSAVALLPDIASAPQFTDESDSDFILGTFTNTEIVGTGNGASVRLIKDIGNWAETNPPTDPGAREGPAYCFDELGGVMVIFGGYAAGFKNDTWEYDFSLNNWIEITTIPKPPVRELGAMAYDSANGVCVLFGGYGPLGYLGDTWEYNVATNTWTETTPFFGPEMISSSAMAFDSSTGRSILVGEDSVSHLMETWAYDASLDSWVFRTEGSPSPARQSFAITYDTSIGRTVFFGGVEAGMPPTYHSDTWEYEYSGNVWTFRGSGGPDPREVHAMAYHASENAVYLFGGAGSSGFFSDTWKRVGVTWSRVTTGQSPSARGMVALVYDSANGYLLMCCGYDGSNPLSDTWALGIFYRPQGFFVSQAFNTGYTSVDYKYLYFNQSAGQWPVNTEIRMRLATSNSPAGPFTCVGPDGTANTWFNQSKNAIPDFHDNHQYIKYCADLISWDGINTPSLDDATITYEIPPSAPYIADTYPANSDIGVPRDTCIYINFSEAMVRATVNVNIYYLNPKVPTGITFTWTWTDGDKRLRLCPQTNFLESKIVQVFVNGTDVDNSLPLIPNPLDPLVVNPFAFVIGGEFPVIESTDPSNQQKNVPLDADVVVVWSEPMDTASVTWRINRGVDPGDWSEGWNSPTDTTLTLSHITPFVECDDLEFEILTGKDKSGKDFVGTGAPNPWSFKTICYSPYVVLIIPVDGEANVPVNFPIRVEFSEPMNPGTLVHDISPNVTLTPSWSDGNRNMTISHPNFQEGTPYTYCIYDIEDLEGYHLLNRPYCSGFMTESNDPYIAMTVPADGATDVDPTQIVRIVFSEQMNTGSVQWTLSPNVPDKATWQETWTVQMDYHVLELAHVEPMLYCAEYTFEVTAGRDLSGRNLIPGIAPNPWSFTTTFEYPCITDTSPYDGETGVGLWKEIVVNFTEAIDWAGMPFDYLVDPSDGGTVWTESWSNGDRTVTLNHSKRLPPSQTITAMINLAYDLDGNLLKNSLAPNPFQFNTVGDPNWPWIEETSPANGDLSVPTNTPLVITFSETMDTASVSWNIEDLDGPSTIVFTPTWSQTVYPEDTLTLNHVELLRECQTYYVTIYGQDPEGNPLQGGPVPNPFWFETVCVYPVITNTDPANLEASVPVGKSIVIDFSEEMQPSSLQWTINPDPGGWTDLWSLGNTRVTLSHTNDFTQCTLHDIQVTRAWDLDNVNIVPGPVPNPWSFTTECVNPYVVSTDPYHTETDVVQERNIVIVFSEPMDRGSIVFQISPSLTFTQSWSVGDTVLTISHTDPFLECQRYDAVVNGTDLDGYPLIPGPSPIPNPWFFTTICINPWIDSTSPADGATQVALDAPIRIEFSETMNTATVSVDVSPGPGGTWTKEWANNDKRLWLNHSNPYLQCTHTTVHVLSGRDLAGLDLVAGPVPNPWSFMTFCPNPYIIRTDPIDGYVGVAIDSNVEIEFNEPMNTGSVTWTINPDPNPFLWGEDWFVGDTLLVLSHPTDFDSFTIYTVTVTGGLDKDGYALIPGPVPNPWSFRTELIEPPDVNWTVPTNGQVNVDITQDIVISFTKEIVPGTFHWNLTMGPDPGGWSESWSQEVYPSDTVTLSHNNFENLTNYCITIEHAKDVIGQDFVSRPYVLCFATVSPLPPVGGLTVTKIPGFVHLEWTFSPEATHYNVYDSTNKFAAFPGGWNMNQVAQPTNTYDFAYLGDGLTHYFIVRAFDSGAGEESTNSTMGVKIEKSFTSTPGRASIDWMSLPFISEYTKASDIANELTEANVNVIAKWDRSKQQVVSYYYARGKWRGRDFSISAGDGMYLSVISSFDWDIVGTDSDASVDLPFSNLPHKQNKHWISVPYTGRYELASDIVVHIEGGIGPNTNTYITEVGLWDPTSQTERVYRYTPTGWSGDNFAVSPGDGIYLRMVQSYTWSPLLVTYYVP